PMSTTKIKLFAFFPLLCACVSLAQVCQAPPGTKDAASRHGIEIPMLVHGGLVFVPVRMSDGKTYSFLLDSGFENSVLDPETVRVLHLSSGDKHVEAAPGGKVESSTVSGVHRSVGGQTLAEESLTTLDLSGLSPLVGHRIDGVLGYDFFHQFVVILDYQHQRLTLCDLESFQAGRGQSVALNLDSHQPYMEAQIESSSGKLIQASIEIDTGKVDPFSLNAAFARKNGLLDNAPALLAMKGVSVRGETQAWVTRAKSLRFAGLVVKNPVMAVAEEDVDRAGGQIGYGLLKRFTITLDYGRKKAVFEPNTSLDQPFEFDHAGFVLGTGGADFSSLTVFMVIAATPAAAAGVQTATKFSPSKTVRPALSP
ncbi:MAG: retropepsin-like aspartic protease, partial [Terriglobales bacterium]